MIFNATQLAAAAHQLPPLSPTMSAAPAIAGPVNTVCCGLPCFAPPDRRFSIYICFGSYVSVSSPFWPLTIRCGAGSGHFLSMRAKDYRTYEVTLSVENAVGLTDLAIGGTKECTLCCNTPGFAVEYTSDAPGVQ